jgi:hypothetical protein
MSQRCQNRTSYALLIRERCDTSRQTIQASGSPTADASDAYSKQIHELGPTLLSMTLSR